MLTTDQLRHVNSMTKYPPIETYHKIDPANGSLLEESVDFGDEGVVFCTEKINGINGRVVVFSDGDWVIGSREELLHARDDRVTNPALGIVAALKEIATRLGDFARVNVNGDEPPVVFFGEVYGHGIDGGKAYTRTRGLTSFRLFDVVVLDDFGDMLTWPIEKVASWRDHGGQRFLNESDLILAAHDIDLVLCPRILTLHASELPTSIDGTRDFLAQVLPATTAALNGEPGRAEGLVIRSESRSVIAKARFEDYDRTLRRRAEAARVK